MFGEPVDDLFCEVTLPDGWARKATSHSMHSDILDEQGRKRIGVFYKAAFYDRKADMYLVTRYTCTTRPIGGYENPRNGIKTFRCDVIDWDGSVLWHSEELEPEPPYPNEDDGRAEWLAWSDEKDELSKVGRAWLDENYPDWQDPTAYW